jgi:uncharacterized phage protein gp47/JayE
MTTFTAQELYDLPPIDARDEETITVQAKDRAKAIIPALSTSLQNDPLDVMVRTLAFVHARMLYRVNLLPAHLLSQLLTRTGVTPIVGSRATYLQRFRLTGGVPNYTIPANFEVRDATGRRYFTTESLVLDNATEGFVPVVAEVAGAAYNTAPFTINRFTVPLAYLASTTNVETLSAGTDSETLEETLTRQLEALTARNPVSARDFEIFAQEEYPGSEAFALGLVAADGQNEELGAVHLWLLSPDDEPASTARVSQVREALLPRIMLGTRLHVSPMPVQEVSVQAVVSVTRGVSLDVLGARLEETARTYLKSLRPGSTVQASELAARMRFSTFDLTEAIEYVEVDAQLAVALPRATKPVMILLSVSYRLFDGRIVQLQYGQGDVE